MYTVELKYPEIDYSLVIKPKKDDFIIYLWEKQLGVKFDPYLYKCDDKEGKLYKKLEDDWLHNKLDEFGLTQSSDFKEFLTEKYKKQTYDSYWDEQESISNMYRELYDHEDL